MCGLKVTKDQIKAESKSNTESTTNEEEKSKPKLSSKSNDDKNKRTSFIAGFKRRLSRDKTLKKVVKSSRSYW